MTVYRHKAIGDNPSVALLLFLVLLVLIFGL